MARYLEDFTNGRIFESPSRTVTEEAIFAFAREYDPQPFHLDPDAATRLFFGRLVASGWHTAALTMRLMVEAGLDIAGGMIGAGVERLRWPVALLPNDTVRVRIEVLQTRASQARPGYGIARLRVRTLRDDGTELQEMIANVLVPRDPQRAG